LAGKLGDLPTMKVEPERFAEYAKRADTHVREGRQASAPNIQVSLEYLEEVPTAVRRSDVLPIARGLEAPGLEVIPVVVVTRDDLAWFDFEPDTHALLALIDGHTTVAEILSLVAVEPDRALELLEDLELQRVIALG
jgi:hypothetical protein